MSVKGRHGSEPRAVVGDSGDPGARDGEGEEGESLVLRGDGRESEEDWVSTVIPSAIANAIQKPSPSLL